MCPNPLHLIPIVISLFVDSVMARVASVIVLSLCLSSSSMYCVEALHIHRCVHTAHPQFLSLWLSAVGWVLTAVILGLIQWRVWHVADLTFITSGEAWVGLWRVCFYSHTLVTSGFRVMYCQSMVLSDSFTPPEVATAQVLTLLGLVMGFCGNAAAVYALRNVCFGLEKQTPIRCAFGMAGTLCLLSAVFSHTSPVELELSGDQSNNCVPFELPHTPCTCDPERWGQVSGSGS